MWKWLIHYRNIMLGNVYCLRFDIHVSGVDSIPIFRWHYWHFSLLLLLHQLGSDPGPSKCKACMLTTRPTGWYNETKATTYSANEVSGTFRYMRWKRIFSPSNSAVGFFIRCSFKWWLSYKAFITQHTQTPQVNLFIMWTTLNHFWWKVIQSTTQCVSSGKRKVLYLASNFNIPYLIMYCPIFIPKFQQTVDLVRNNDKMHLLNLWPNSKLELFQSLDK